MVGVQDYMDCDVCGSKDSFFYEFQTRTGEEYSHCAKCGYVYRRECMIDKKKTDRLKDGHTYLLFKKDGSLRFYTTEKKGFGSYRYTKDGGGCVGTINKEENIQPMIEHLQDLKQQGFTVEMTVFLDGELKEINI